jgi:hypothetical protein
MLRKRTRMNLLSTARKAHPSPATAIACCTKSFCHVRRQDYNDWTLSNAYLEVPETAKLVGEQVGQAALRELVERPAQVVEEELVVRNLNISMQRARRG